MRRADRLFRIVQQLEGRRLTTAAQLAARLEVSERTIYRDIRDLSVSGIPVRGEAGVGYSLPRGFHLTPLMFTPDEVEAVVAGIRMVAAFGGPQLRRASESALEKVALVLPPERREETGKARIFAPGFAFDPKVGERLEVLRQAIAVNMKILITYSDRDQAPSIRTLRPLGLYFWGPSWTVLAWCESRNDFRSFRLDRIQTLETGTESFVPEEGKRLEDFLERISRRPPHL